MWDFFQEKAEAQIEDSVEEKTEAKIEEFKKGKPEAIDEEHVMYKNHEPHTPKMALPKSKQRAIAQNMESHEVKTEAQMKGPKEEKSEA